MRESLVFLVVAGLMLAGCGSSAEEEGSTSTTAGDRTTTVAAAPTTTTTTTTMTTTTVAGSGDGGDECLVGTWALDSDAFVENFAEIFAAAGMPGALATPLGGRFTVEFSAGGSLETVRDQWGFSIDAEEVVLTVETNGGEIGTWSADGTTLTAVTDVSEVEVEAFIETGGQVIPFPFDEFPVQVPTGIASDSAYTCTGDVLTLTNDEVESVLHRSG